MNRGVYIGCSVVLMVVAVFQDRIQSALVKSEQPSLREATDSATPTADELNLPHPPDFARVAEVGSVNSAPPKQSLEELGLFLESHGLPRILAKEAWAYGKTIQAVLKTGNNPRSGDLATDQALTSWSNICVMRLTRKYRMEPQVIRHFFAVVQSNNPALKP